MSARNLVLATGLGLVALLGAACEPFVLFSGGALSGEVAPTPSDWEFTSEVETIQLETRPAAPYSVNVWAVGLGDRLYVACGRQTNRWAQYIQDDPDVRVRIGETLYELRADRVEDAATLERVLAGMKQKYDFEPDAEQREGAILFALSPRS